MPTEATVIRIENTEEAAKAIEEAAGRLDSMEGGLIVDFSHVARIDSATLQALETLARAAEDKATRPSLASVEPPVYKALKLAKLTQRLAFVN